MAGQVFGTISAAGLDKAVAIDLDIGVQGLLVELSGNYAGAALIFERLLLGGSWRGVAGVTRDNVYTALLPPFAQSPLPLPDSGSRVFRFQVPGSDGFRVWATSLSGGTINVTFTPGGWPPPLPSYAL